MSILIIGIFQDEISSESEAEQESPQRKKAKKVNKNYVIIQSDDSECKSPHSLFDKTSENELSGDELGGENQQSSLEESVNANIELIESLKQRLEEVERNQGRFHQAIWNPTIGVHGKLETTFTDPSWNQVLSFLSMFVIDKEWSELDDWFKAVRKTKILQFQGQLVMHKLLEVASLVTSNVSYITLEKLVTFHLVPIHNIACKMRLANTKFAKKVKEVTDKIISKADDITINKLVGEIQSIFPSDWRAKFPEMQFDRAWEQFPDAKLTKSQPGHEPKYCPQIKGLKHTTKHLFPMAESAVPPVHQEAHEAFRQSFKSADDSYSDFNTEVPESIKYDFNASGTTLAQNSQNTRPSSPWAYETTPKMIDQYGEAFLRQQKEQGALFGNETQQVIIPSNAEVLKWKNFGKIPPQKVSVKTTYYKLHYL